MAALFSREDRKENVTAIRLRINRMRENKIVTIPNWMYATGGMKLKKEQQQKGIEGGLDMVKFTDQCSSQFINKSLGCVPLGVNEDDIDAAIGDSIRLCVDILDGKAKNIVAMKGE